jgi:hypothetical protein
MEKLLTGIIFSSSVQHAADGNGMFDIYGNPPNHPVLMRLPTPTEVKIQIVITDEKLATTKTQK